MMLNQSDSIAGSVAPTGLRGDQSENVRDILVYMEDQDIRDIPVTHGGLRHQGHTGIQWGVRT